MREYVVGYLFAEHLDGERVLLLILKNRPEWQKGRWNAPGGKVEPNEQPLAAMRREYLEETGLDSTQLGLDWKRFATLCGDSTKPGAGSYQIHFFGCETTPDVLDCHTQPTDEFVSVWALDDLPTIPIVPNMPWLISMWETIRKNEDSAKLFEVREYGARKVT